LFWLVELVSICRYATWGGELVLGADFYLSRKPTPGVAAYCRSIKKPRVQSVGALYQAKPKLVMKIPFRFNKDSERP
jgi:hypothetical protein